MEKLTNAKDKIISLEHFHLILERFLAKRLYENNFISFELYESIKSDIDHEIQAFRLDTRNFASNRKLDSKRGNGI